MLDFFCDPIDDHVGLDEQVLSLNYRLLDGKASTSRNSSSLGYDRKAQESKSSSELIADALKAISLEERGKVEKELYGIELDDGQEVVESSEFQESKIRQMLDEVQRLKAASTWSLQLAGIEMAERQNISYVRSPRLLLKFLRCDHWDATKAASRFIRFFDWKLELFGEASLARDIALHDLPPEDIKALKKGYMQRLPERDRAGRAILCTLYNGQTYDSPESLARLWMYLANTLDEESDKKGVVMISFKLADVNFAHTKGRHHFLLYLRRVLSDLPVHWCAMHKCLEETVPAATRVNMLVESAISTFNQELRVRVLLHYGSYTEWMYKLMCYGIPHHLIPLTSDYKLKIKNHLDYLAMRMIAEGAATGSGGNNNIEMIDLPSNNDVLLGKGKPIQEYRGNQKLSLLVDTLVLQYDTLSKSEKTALAADIVNKVKASNGRFLTKDSGIWIEVSDDMARDKVSHMFRHQRQKATFQGKGLEKTDCKKIIVRREASSTGSSTTAMSCAEYGTSKRIKM